MQKNYIAYSSEFCEYEEFDTFEEAEAWLKETWDDIRSNGEGYDPSIDGGDYIAKITHRSTFVETDNADNYCSLVCGDCDNPECDSEQRPYGSEIERVGEIKLKEIESEKNNV